MMGARQEAQAALFYELSLEDHIPQDHLLRFIDRFVDLASVRTHLADFYSHTGRPSIDPELLIRMLLIGYCFGIRSERRLCEEVHLNLAYRWFCRLDLTDRIPDHSSFSKNPHDRFRESDLLRHVFETSVLRGIEEGFVGGQGFAVDASLISADPASHWTAVRKGPTFFAYSDSYLIDTDHGIIVDVDASRSNNTAEVGAMRKMLDQTEKRFGLKPDWIEADTAYGSSDTLVWLALTRQILPFIPIFDKGERTDGTFPRSDFTGCELKAKRCTNAETRSVHRDKYEIVRDFARQCTTSDFNPKAQARRKKVEMFFAHLKRILAWDGSGYGAHAAFRTSLSMQPPPKTSGNSQSSNR